MHALSWEGSMAIIFSLHKQSGVRKDGGKGERMGGGAETPRVTHDFLAAMIS